MARLLRHRFTQHLPLVLLLTGFSVWGVLHLGGFAWDWDEGVLLMTGRMVARGYPLYTEIWYHYPPLYPFLLAGAFRLLGEGVAVGRGMTLAFSLVGLIAAAWVARLVSRSRWPGLAAAIVLLLSPPFLVRSRAALVDLPAASLSTLAVAMALRYLRQGRAGWLVAAGLSLGLSVLLKPTAAFTVAPVLLAVWLRGRGDPENQRTIGQVVSHTALLFVGAICALATGLLPVDMGCFWQQMMGTYWASRGVHLLDLGQNLHRVWAYLTWVEYGPPQYGFLAPAAFGGVGLFRRRVQPTGWVLLAWLGLACGTLLSHAPLRNKHLISLLFPLTVVVGCGLDWLAQLIRDWPHAMRLHRGLAIAGLVAVALYAIGLPRLWATNRALAYPHDSAGDRDALVTAQELRAMVPPGGFIVTDSLMLAFHSERNVPPELVNTSKMRIRTGQLRAEQLISHTQAYQPSAIIFWDYRLESLSAYVDWVDQHYCLARAWSDAKRLYEACRMLRRSDGLGMQFGDLFGVEAWNVGVSGMSDRVASPGDTVLVTLHWRALQPTDAEYHVFCHLGGEALIAQWDGRPRWGADPTSGWLLGEEVIDSCILTVPPDAPPGYYPLWLGMYDWADRDRLPVKDAQGEHMGYAALLTHVRVGWPEFEVPSISERQEARLGDQVRLLGYDLPLQKARPGDVVNLTLYWQCLKETDISYTVFTHILDSKGNMVGQWDSVPDGGNLPTESWAPGEVVVDQYQIPIVMKAQPGPCRIEVGMYDVSTGQRLPVFDAVGQRMEFDRLLLDTPIEVDES